VSDPLSDLVDLLALEPIEVNIFRGLSPDEDRQRVFGGQVAGQALMAAARTVDVDHLVHSLHAYFLRPGDPNAPILYDVDRIRDGRSFTTRRVVAIQHGRAIFNLQASFHAAEDGLEYQIDMPADLPRPESLPTFAERMAPWADQLGGWLDRPRPIDTRPLDWRPPVGRAEMPPSDRQRMWWRADGILPDDPYLHACVAAYASDISLLDTVLLPHGLSWHDGTVMMASLDHAMWFHRPFRADRWALFDQQVISTGGARGLARGEMFTEEGLLAVSVVQEGLARPISRS
jgi:acyl-CoA thioesterase II